jgi:hypothetical protein
MRQQWHHQKARYKDILRYYYLPFATKESMIAVVHKAQPLRHERP